MMLSNATYDEREVLNAYIMHNADYYMTEFESRCVRLGILREKAEASDVASLHDRSRETWSREADQDVERALASGVWEYQMQIRQRLLREYDEGTLQVNRCPKCDRIVRTPLAKQCQWCGHDWHGK